MFISGQLHIFDDGDVDVHLWAMHIKYKESIIRETNWRSASEGETSD
jgi:hypothetical protein